jgi:hypothetical protein
VISTAIIRKFLAERAMSTPDSPMLLDTFLSFEVMTISLSRKLWYLLQSKEKKNCGIYIFVTLDVLRKHATQ